MANLLSLLNTGLGATANLQNAQLEGREIGRKREEAGLLAQLKAAQDAEDRALRQRLTEAQITNYEDLARERQEPKAVTPQFVTELGGYVRPDTNTFTPVQGIPKATGKTYEERPEKGGVAIYEDGKFKTWKLRPPQEREPSPMAGEITEQRRFQREQGLADDFRQEQAVKDASGVAGAVTTIRGALSQNTPQADLAAIYALVKLYDPGSVVREGEIALTQSASSLPQRVRLLWQGWNTGRKLLPEQRAALSDIADGIVAERQQQVNPILQRYGQRARTWGVDSAAVAPDPFESLGRTRATLAAKYGLEVKP